MDPKSCRQTPHWIIAMICSLSCLISSNATPVLSYQNVFLSWLFHVLLRTVSTVGKVQTSGRTSGLFSSSLVLQKSRSRFLSTTWNIVPNFVWHFYVQVSGHLYLYWIQPLVLRLKSCCVYEGGDDVGEVLYLWLRVTVGKKEAILTFRRDNTPLSFRPTHDRVACRFQFYLLL